MRAPELAIASAFYFISADRFSGRSQVAISTRMLPNTNKMPTALCLFLSIANLRCFMQLTVYIA
jgi:hypothetical protein